MEGEFLRRIQKPRWLSGITKKVFKTRRRTVRADFRLLASEPPGGEYAGGHRAWEQDVVGTPFERVLAESITEIVVEPGPDGGTQVTLAQRQKLRGYSKTGAWAMRSATAKRLDQALEGLARALG